MPESDLPHEGGWSRRARAVGSGTWSMEGGGLATPAVRRGVSVWEVSDQRWRARAWRRVCILREGEELQMMGTDVVAQHVSR